MDKKVEGLSLGSRRLSYKLKISFYLMSIIPLLLCFYLISNYIFPRVGFKLDVTIFITFSILVAVAGFFVVKEVFDRIITVSTEAKLIANGKIDKSLSIEQADELGDLGNALNRLTQRIRSNMAELNAFGARTTEINIDIQKRIIVLSNLLQISSLISQEGKLEDILRLAVEKSRLLANGDVSFLLFREEEQETFYVKIVDGINADYLLKVSIGPEEDLFNKVFNIDKPLILDRENLLTQDLTAAFYEKFRLRNVLALPVHSKGRVTAILGIGNKSEPFVYKAEDIELLDIFAKQIAIAIENDVLIRRVEKLEIKDALTGLYNKTFIRSRLQEEIRRAIIYQRPCSFILFDIDNFKLFQQKFGLLQAEAALKNVASLIKNSVTEIDLVARTGDDEFAVVLPEKNKRKAQDMAENIRKRVEFIFSEEPDAKKKITISGGVSENPLDGINDEELINSATELLQCAKSQGRNRIVGLKEPTACR